MLVTLANNTALGANSTTTFSYSPTSFQKLFLKIDDDSVTPITIFVTIQLGSRTIVNDIPAFGLVGYQQMYSGFTNGSTDSMIMVDCGSWQLMNNENLYVTVRTTNAMNAIDVSAIVDEATLNPIQYTVYSDNVFTSENVLCALGYNVASGSAVDEDASNVTIRNQVMSSSPSVMSGVSFYRSQVQQDLNTSNYSLLYKESRPHTTSFNYPSSATMDQIVIAQSIPYTRAMLQQAKNTSFLNQAYAS